MEKEEIEEICLQKESSPSEKIRRLIRAVLEKMGTKGEVEVIEAGEETRFAIRTPEAGILIGENGQNLTALNHLIKRITSALPLSERIPFSIDINDYQAKRIEELKTIARIGAQRVRYFKKAVLIRPMTAYERRVIHTALMEYPDIITESVGQEPKRRVMIRPYN